jgi:GH18 family chitinase
MSIVFRRAGAASRRRKNVLRAVAMLGIAAKLLDVVGCGSGDEAQQHLVTQYFAIFNDGTTDNFHACLDLNPPYQLWDMTFIAFLHTYRKGDVYVADYENARGHDDQQRPIPPAPGDTDRDRIRQLREAALRTNPAMKFIISLGWGRDDFSNGAQNPTEFASSVGNIVVENDLDGFDIDFESDSIEPDAFGAVSRALRAELDARATRMGKQLYLTITPAQLGVDLVIVDQYYDYVQMQSYDAPHDMAFSPTNVVGREIASTKIFYGRDIEGGDTLSSTRYGVPDVVAYVRENHLAGLMSWRVNAANQMAGMPHFGGVRLLGEAFRVD